MWIVLCLLFLSAGATCLAQDPDPNRLVEPSRLQALEYRFIGPYRGGRVTAVSGVPAEPFTFYMGSTGGGVWKTEDAGTTWENLSDGYFAAGSIGSIAVAPSDANVVYAGTGSAAARGNVSTGKGLYRSTDGGKSWKLTGLENGGQIGKIVVHPRDANRVYAAVLGNVFGKSPQRGVFRSIDGGDTWEHVLAHSDSVGAIDLEIDPANPRNLFAGLWRVERKPWTLIDGSTEGGLYRSVDGGDTWEKLTSGLPNGLVGKVGVAVSPANPSRIWVLQEAAEVGKGGLFRSDDGGASFIRVNKERRFLQRAWYYSYVIADPQDEHTVYVLNTGMYRSTDGGRTFETIETPHGDNHDLWINPNDPRIMIEGNDGGANVSLNGGATWSTQFNQPTAEFYRVTTDNAFPYRVYGAQQDNTTISVPSRSPGGITPKQHWIEVGGGESGHIAVDPRDPAIIYAGNYIGQITRLDRNEGHMRDVVAYPQMHDGTAPRDIRYRFQWNAPIRISPHDPDILYHTSQYVHRSSDGGVTWEVTSPDLTTNNDAYHELPGGPIQHDHTGVELYTTIFAFEESPLEPGVLWAGSDDGRVHVSRDNGGSWQDVTPASMPAGGTVNSIDISRHEPGRVFLAVYKYRENDFRPYVFSTENYGSSWRLLTSGENGIPGDYLVRVVREDPDRAGLLYAGTEFGVFVSFNAGSQWQPLQLNLPVTPVTDLQIKNRDLVVATQGRSFWILDDLSPLHQFEVDRVPEVDLLQPRTAYRTQLRGYREGGSAPQRAPDGALIYTWFETMPDTAGKPVRLEIRDGEGVPAAAFSTRPDQAKGERKLELKLGLNRHVWDLRYPAPRLIEGSMMSLAYTGGALAPPGTYTVTLLAADTSLSAPLEVMKDPRWSASDEDLRAQHTLAFEVRDLLDEIHGMIRSLRTARTQAKEIAERAVGAGYPDTLQTAARTLADSLTALEERLIQTKNESGQDPINFPPQLDDQFAYLYSIIVGQDAHPTAGCYERLDDLRAELSPFQTRYERLTTELLPAFNRLLDTSEVPRIVLPAKP